MKKLTLFIVGVISLQLNFCVAQQDVVNGDFEFWDSIPGTNALEDPYGWTSDNYLVYNCTTSTYNQGVWKSKDAYSSNYSLKICNTNFSSDSKIGMAFNCQSTPCYFLGCDNYQTTYNYQKLVGYFKFYPDSAVNNSANINITTYSIDTITGGPMTASSGTFWFSPSSSWTYFEVPIYFWILPEIQGEFLQISINLLGSNPSINSSGYLLIDSLGLVPEVVTGLENNQNSELKLSPNPVQNQLDIQSNFAIQKYEIFDLSGRVKKTAAFEKEIDVSHLAKGIYFLRLQGKKINLVEKFVKE